LKPATVARLLCAAIGFLALAHVAGLALRYGLGHDYVYGLIRLFDIGSEQNVPAFFSAAQLLLASVLLATIAASRKDEWTPKWATLSFAFLFMAFDEAASIHELLSRPTTEVIGDMATGLLFYAWVVPGFMFALLFALWFRTFFSHLPRKTKRLFAIAASLFIGGALGMEVLEARHVELHGGHNLTYGLYVMAEETLELAGVSLFIYALLKYVEAHIAPLQMRVTDVVSPHRTAPSETLQR
jgi:hypothetical protein